MFSSSFPPTFGEHGEQPIGFVGESGIWSVFPREYKRGEGPCHRWSASTIAREVLVHFW